MCTAPGERGARIYSTAMELVRPPADADADGLAYAKLVFLDGDVVLVKKMPLLLGREDVARSAASPFAGQFVKLSAKTVSREHALVSWDAEHGRYSLSVKGRNPVIVAGRKAACGEVLPLANKTPIAISSFKFYFLLPQPPRGQHALGMIAPLSPAEPGGGDKAKKPKKDNQEKDSGMEKERKREKKDKKKAKKDKKNHQKQKKNNNNKNQEDSSSGGVGGGGGGGNTPIKKKKASPKKRKLQTLSVGTDVDGCKLTNTRSEIYLAIEAITAAAAADGGNGNFTQPELKDWLVANRSYPAYVRRHLSLLLLL